MKTKLITLLLIISSFGCNEFKKEKPKKNKLILAAITAYAYNFTDECLADYVVLNNLYNSYLNVFPTYNGAKVLWIADSTIDFARYEPNFITELSDNRAIYGNTACDFLNQIRSVSVGYETLIVGTMDGNGVLRGVSADTSIKTLKKVFSYGKDVLQVKNLILLGIHPIPDESINTRKNVINNSIKSIANEQGYCYIDMVTLFGKTETQFPDSYQMKPGDKIHYSSVIYPLLKSKIKTQCGVDI